MTKLEREQKIDELIREKFELSRGLSLNDHSKETEEKFDRIKEIIKEIESLGYKTVKPRKNYVKSRVTNR